MRSVLTQRHIRWRTDILYPPDASTPQRVSDLDAIGESLEIVEERKRRIDVNVCSRKRVITCDVARRRSTST